MATRATNRTNVHPALLLLLLPPPPPPLLLLLLLGCSSRAVSGGGAVGGAAFAVVGADVLRLLMRLRRLPDGRSEARRLGASAA